MLRVLLPQNGTNWKALWLPATMHQLCRFLLAAGLQAWQTDMHAIACLCNKQRPPDGAPAYRTADNLQTTTPAAAGPHCLLLPQGQR